MVRDDTYKVNKLISTRQARADFISKHLTGYE